MAQESTATLPASGIPKSLSDRPWAVRALVQSARFMRTRPLGAVGMILIALVFLAALLAPVIQRYHPDRDIAREPLKTCAPEELENPKIQCFSPELAVKAETDPTVRLRYDSSRFEKSVEGQIVVLGKPSTAHWLGTDLRGHDLWSRIVWGARGALIYGIGASLIAVTLGTIVGMLSAYFGGIADFLIQRVTDTLQAFPTLILLLIFTQVVENPNRWWIVIALGLIGIASVVRIARSAVLTTREEVYVSAARVVGASDIRVMLRHILPNIVAPLIVIFTISIGLYILAEAGLAFIGLGNPTDISWGKMINEGRTIASRPLMALFVGLALTFTVLGFNLAGDALRDALDPRLRGRGGRAGF